MGIRTAVKNAKSRDLFPDLTAEDRAYNEGYVDGERTEREKHGMDAEMYLKEKARMCGRDCAISFFMECVGCDSWIEQHPAEAVRIVEEWSKKHPIQTNGDKLKEVFGNIYLGFIAHIENDYGDLSIEWDKSWWDAPYEPPKGE